MNRYDRTVSPLFDSLFRFFNSITNNLIHRIQKRTGNKQWDVAWTNYFRQFLGIIQIIKVDSLTGQDATDASVTNTNASSRYKDPLLAKLWPNRTLTTNEERIRTLAIALQNADRVLNGKRSRKNEQSEKPRIFGSPIMAAELRPRSDDGPRDSPRRNVRLRSRPTGRFSTPASVLLPPYKSYTPDFDFNSEKSAQPLTSTVKNNVVSTEPPTSRTAPSSETYEPPPTQPSRDETKNPIQQRGPNENNVKRYFPQNSKHQYENRHEFPSTPTQQAETTFPPYWGTTTSEPLQIKLNTNATVTESARERGPAKYNQNTKDNEISKKTDVFSPEESGYHWGRRPVQTVNHYKFVGGYNYYVITMFFFSALWLRILFVVLILVCCRDRMSTDN